MQYLEALLHAPQYDSTRDQYPGGAPGMLIAYFLDIPCDDAYETDVRMAALCATCRACVKNCPIGAIQKNLFVIDNEKYLS